MAYNVQTIFSALDQYSGKVAVMGANTNAFSEKINVLNARIDRTFNKFIPASLGKATKTLLAYGEAAIFIEGAMKSGKAVLDYETEIANLSAVTGATGHTLDVFKTKIVEVAAATKKSSIEVAKAFTNVDNNMPQFHTNATALTEVTKQSIILAKAGRMELGPAAESLTMSMNQFGLGADKAAEAVDILAAGAVAGSSRISETTEAMQKFGAAADQVIKISFAESVALVELASKFEKGSEAGTKARNILLDMANVKFGPAAKEVRGMGVDISRVVDESLPLYDRLKELSKIKSNPEVMEKLFDKRNITVASGIFSVLDKYPDLLEKIGQKGLAEKMAITNTDTLNESVNQLVAAWETEITTSNKVGFGLNALKGTIRFVTDHMDGLVTVVASAATVFYGWKIAVWGVAGAANIFKYSLIALNYTTSISSALMGYYRSSMFATEAGMLGMAHAAAIAKVGFIGMLGPIGLVIGVLSLFALAASDDFDETERLSHGLDKTKNGFKQIKEPINQATIALQHYNAAMDDYNSLTNLDAHRRYAYGKGYWHGVAVDMKEWIPFIGHPGLMSTELMKDFGGFKSEQFLPNKADFPGLDSAQFQKEYLPIEGNGKQAQTDTKGETSYVQPDVIVNLYANVDKAGNITLSPHGSGLNLPFIGTTNAKRNA